MVAIMSVKEGSRRRLGKDIKNLSGVLVIVCTIRTDLDSSEVGRAMVSAGSSEITGFQPLSEEDFR